MTTPATPPPATAIATVEDLMARYRRLYRDTKGKKPGAICVTDAQFDALCDLPAIANEMRLALEYIVEGAPYGVVWSLTEAQDKARHALLLLAHKP